MVVEIVIRIILIVIALALGFYLSGFVSAFGKDCWRWIKIKLGLGPANALIVIYTPCIDDRDKDDLGKTELDNFTSGLESLTQNTNWKVLHIWDQSITQIKTEIFFVPTDISPQDIKSISKDVFALLTIEVQNKTTDSNVKNKIEPPACEV